jgi:hypothetical protein
MPRSNRKRSSEACADQFPAVHTRFYNQGGTHFDPLNLQLAERGATGLLNCISVQAFYTGVSPIFCASVHGS